MGALHSWKSRCGPAPNPHRTSTSANTNYSTCSRERCVSIRQEKLFDVQAGGVAFLPQSQPHAFACLTSEVRALLLAAASGEQTVGMDGYFLAMGEPARDMVLPDAVMTNAGDDPEQAIKVGASWGIRFLTPEDTKNALPLYLGLDQSKSALKLSVQGDQTCRR
jgi:hypothetical protein